MSRSFFVCPAWANSNGFKSRTRPSNGKRIAKDKGVHCEMESEGSPRQISGPTYRNHMRRRLRVRLRKKLKPSSYYKNQTVYMWRIDGEEEFVP